MAAELTAKDVIRAHARDELGIDVDDLAKPLQAAGASAFAFTVGAALPLLAGAFLGDYVKRLLVIVAVSTVGLAAFGVTGAPPLVGLVSVGGCQPPSVRAAACRLQLLPLSLLLPLPQRLLLLLLQLLKRWCRGRAGGRQHVQGRSQGGAGRVRPDPACLAPVLRRHAVNWDL